MKTDEQSPRSLDLWKQLYKERLPNIPMDRSINGGELSASVRVTLLLAAVGLFFCFVWGVRLLMY